MATSGTVDAGEYETHDLQLQWPFRMLLAGCSMLTTRLVALSWPGHRLVSWSFTVICSRLTGNWLGKLLALYSCWTGAKHFTEQLTTEPGTLAIVDDMQGTHARLLSSWFKRRAHHYDSSIIHLVQNVFDKDPSHRTISLNTTYIILFNNPRDMSQVSHLDKQVYPDGNGMLTTAYRNATSSRAHSYVVIDFNQSTPEKFYLHNTLFPDEDFPEAFPYGPTSQAWEEGSHCRGGSPPSPAMGPRSGWPGTTVTRLWSHSWQRPRLLDLHHSAGIAPAGTEGLGKPGRGRTAQDCTSQGLCIVGAADGWWIYQLEACSLGLIVDGIEHKDTNLVDLARHVVRQRQPGIR